MLALKVATELKQLRIIDAGIFDFEYWALDIDLRGLKAEIVWFSREFSATKKHIGRSKS